MSKEIDCYIYSKGIVHCSVCVPKGFSKEEIAAEVNRIYPSGVNPWKVSDDPTFKNGEPNPNQCEQKKEREHVLLVC